MNEAVLNLLLAAVILLILGIAAVYIVREKKRGVQCVGCPYAKTCRKAGAGGCGGIQGRGIGYALQVKRFKRRNSKMIFANFLFFGIVIGK